MTLKEYYNILGLPGHSTVEEIKTAYRKKARLYHPDINHSPDAKENFITATEAYDFLIAYHEKIQTDEQAYYRAMDDWRKYRQDRSRRRATSYASSSYRTFRNTRYYKQTKIFDGTRIIFSLITSILVIVYTIFGYIYRLHHPLPGIEKPSLFAFIMLLLLGLIFLVVSIAFLKAYIETSGKQKKKI